MAVRFTALCLFLATAAAQAAPPKEKDPKEDRHWLEKVHTSIDRGVEFLLTKQAHAGDFPAFEDTRGEIYELGMHALATLAVIKGGHPQDSPEVRKALKALYKLYDLHSTRLFTYEVALTLMVLDAKYHTVPPRAKYSRRRKKPKYDPADLKIAKDLVVWLQTKQKPTGLWRYPEGGSDLSNSQYAILGLWSGRRMGIKVNKGVIRRLMEETLHRQQKEGKQVPFILDPGVHKQRKDTGERRSGTTIAARGWRYMPFDIVRDKEGKRVERKYPYSGSMTTAGIAILAIGRDILGKDDVWLRPAQDRRVRRAMWEGFAWLQDKWDLYDNPGQKGNWPFYWLYGLERAARLAGVEYVGKYDWYYSGCNRLMADQRADGSWPKQRRMKPPGEQNVRWWSDQVDTCFAILFLAKATPEIKTPAPTITVD